MKRIKLNQLVSPKGAHGIYYHVERRGDSLETYITPCAYRGPDRCRVLKAEGGTHLPTRFTIQSVITGEVYGKQFTLDELDIVPEGEGPFDAGEWLDIDETPAHDEGE
jgi:hypothetical protein